MSEIKQPQIITSLSEEVYTKYRMLAHSLLQVGINDSFTWGQRETIFAEFSLINGCNFCYETHTILAELFEHHAITYTIRNEIHALMTNNYTQNKNISEDVYQNLIKIKECAVFINAHASKLVVPKDINEQMQLIHDDGYYYPEETTT